MMLAIRLSRGHRQILTRLTCLILLIVAANVVADWVAEALKFEIRPSNEDVVHATIMIAAIAHALLIAIPFVPGVEIGLTLISMFGPRIVLLVYVCTIVGLSLSFVVGRLVNLARLVKVLDNLRFFRASRLLAVIDPMPTDDRLTFLCANAPHRLIPFLLRHRYIALAMILNVPGNIVIGGGGGIALMAGASRLYSGPGFLAAIAAGVSPLPLAILLFGTDVLST